MATISTLPGGTKGYSLYIDGFLAGVLNGNNTYLGGSLQQSPSWKMSIVSSEKCWPGEVLGLEVQLGFHQCSLQRL